MNGQRKIRIQVRVSPNGKAAKRSRAKEKGKLTSRRDYPQSTNVSSPVQAATTRRNIRKAKIPDRIDEDTDGDYDDDPVVDDHGMMNCEPVYASEDAVESTRSLRKLRTRQRRQLGPPITIDEKIEGLNPTHRYVVDDFMVHATDECKKASF